MNYKLYKGDCLEVMDRLIEEGIKVNMVLTDPPFGTTRNKWDSIIPLDEMWKRLDKLIKPNGAIILFAQTPFDKVLGASNLKMLRYEWIWNKKLGTGHLNAKKMPMKKYAITANSLFLSRLRALPFVFCGCFSSSATVLPSILFFIRYFVLSDDI